MSDEQEKEVILLALRPKAAARALGIGQRLLWSRTNAGEIPCVRIGRTVVYPVDLLRNYLVKQAHHRERHCERTQ